MSTEELVTPTPEMKQHVSDLKSHAREGVENLRRDVSNLAQDAKDHATRGAGALRDEANARVGEVRDRALDLFADLKTFATEKPLRTFAIGVLLGLFLARRRHA